MPDEDMFGRFEPAVRAFTGDPQNHDLLIASSGDLSTYYAPFEWINREAKVVIAGITPGRSQAINSLREAQRQLELGAASDVALVQAKQTGAFSGQMRKNLTEMLDYIGLDDWLNVTGTATLFDNRPDLLQSSSVLQYPVFVNGREKVNYNGSPDIAKTPFLRDLLLRFFSTMLDTLPNAVVIPLGEVPERAINWLIQSEHIAPRVVLAGLPHPSPANNERVSYFLEKKPRCNLSEKTDPDKIDAARTSILRKVASLAPIH